MVDKGVGFKEYKRNIPPPTHTHTQPAINYTLHAMAFSLQGLPESLAMWLRNRRFLIQIHSFAETSNTFKSLT